MTSEVWGARLDGGYLGTDWVKELLADFHSEENRAEMLEKELLNKKTSLEHLRGILCTVADRAEKAEISRDFMLDALKRIEDHHNETEEWREIARAALAVKVAT